MPKIETKIGPKHTDFSIQELGEYDIAKIARRRNFAINAIILTFTATNCAIPRMHVGPKKWNIAKR
jgi:hypothetical protein